MRRWWRRCASRAAPISAPARPSARTRRRDSSPWRGPGRCRSGPGNRRERKADTMCGIVGAAARRDIVPVLVEGLRRLEYRGYDSCGVAVLFDGQIGRVRSVSRVADLAVQVGEKHFGGATGIAHTRWATHGAPATENAHPLVSRGDIALVHNGIIENHEELRAERSEEHTSELQSRLHLVCRLLLEKKKNRTPHNARGQLRCAKVGRRRPRAGGRRGAPRLVAGLPRRWCGFASRANSRQLPWAALGC